MAKVKLHPYLRTAHGGLDGLVFYRRYGKIYIKARTIPSNPRTEPQVKCRGNFGGGVKAWQVLPDEEKALYRNRAKRKRKSGYNLFMSEYLRGIAPSSPVTPSGNSGKGDAVVVSASGEAAEYTCCYSGNSRSADGQSNINAAKDKSKSANTGLKQYENGVKNRFNTVSTPLPAEKNARLKLYASCLRRN